MQDVRTILSREESYAIHALIYAGSHPGASAAKIADDLEMPKAFLAKVLRRLGEAGLLRSQQGRSGGVWLDTPLDQLSVLRVVEAISGPLIMDTCQAEVLCATQRRAGSCRLNLAFHHAGQQIRTILGGIRLHTLAEGPGRAQPPTAGEPAP